MWVEQVWWREGIQAGPIKGGWGDVASLGLRVGSAVYMLMLALTSHG